MNPVERLNGYLRRLERQLRLIMLCRGAAVLAGTALAVTILAVLLANHFAFAGPSVSVARWLLYLALALAAAFALAVPLVRLNRVQAARQAERRAPELEQRLVTLAERDDAVTQPEAFLELLAADALDRMQELNPPPLRVGSRTGAYASLTAAALGALVWLIVRGPGFLGYGAALLWAGPERPAAAPYYAILVSPGNATLRRHADQLVTARLVGFQAAEVRLAARYQGASKWEEAAMRPQAGGAGFELLLAGIPENLEYYVLAGKLRSPTYTLRVADLPLIKRIRVTYRYPAWTGLGPAVEDPGGDLRAVEGSEAEVAVETDRPLANAALALGDGSYLPLTGGAGNWSSARLKIAGDGRYYIAARDNDEWVRLSEDYLILAEKDSPPQVRVRRPGRDARVSPIEEVTIAAEASDEFAVKELTLTYSVNGGPERKVTLYDKAGARQAEGSAVLYLEDFRLSPGDVVSFYAQARDARQTTQTDIYFLEAQPFEREYSQSQQMAGEGAGEGGEQEENRISERQKEIIAATWNQIRQRSRDQETARFLAGVQSKLRDQAQSLARRLESRELSLANQEFQTFSQEMAKAAEAMSAAAGKLEGARWQEALGPEQQALQHLLRAEATFRQIQVAFGNRGRRGGGGRGGAGRDLESLFELELDTEKNQYETAQRAAPRNAGQRELDEALRKLEELARRQQELAERRTPRLPFEQRWQQEMLRREAAELQRQMERLARQAGGGQSEEGAQAGGAASAAQGGRLRQMGRSGVDPRVQQALDRLAQAARDMGQPGGQQQAAEQLRQARDILSGLQRQQAGERLADMARRGERLAAQQRDFAERLRRTYGDQQGRGTREQAERLADEKQQMLGELERLQRELAESARELAAGQRAAASRLREALGDLQRQELTTRMRYNAELIRRGWGQLAVMREAPVTAGLDELRDQLREAQAALDRGAPGAEQLPRALEALERARQRLSGERGQPPGSQPEQRGQPAGQQAGAAAQPGGLMGRQQGAGGPAPGSYAAMNFGDWQPAEPRSASPSQDPAAFARAYQDAVRELTRLRGTLAEAPDEARELEALLSEFRRYDPRRTPGNPALLERMRAQFLAELDRLELQWRRRLGEAAEAARTAAGEPAPPGYAEAVAEYFRRLSRQR